MILLYLKKRSRPYSRSDVSQAATVSVPPKPRQLFDMVHDSDRASLSSRMTRQSYATPSIRTSNVCICDSFHSGVLISNEYYNIPINEVIGAIFGDDGKRLFLLAYQELGSDMTVEKWKMDPGSVLRRNVSHHIWRRSICNNILSSKVGNKANGTRKLIPKLRLWLYF